MLCYSNFLKLILCTLPIFVKSFIYFNLPNSIVHVPCSTVHGTKTQHIWRCFSKTTEDAYIIIIIGEQNSFFLS